MKNTIYYKQAELLLRVLPIISRYPVFALKGGTAINFFLKDLPRLSVDIDLTYLPVLSREESLQSINSCMKKLRSDIEKLLPKVKISENLLEKGKIIGSLYIRLNEVTVKIETNFIIRGAVFQSVLKSISPKVRELFEIDFETQILSEEDIYAGKICAALDRQHPRDLFDIYLLLKEKSITERMKQAFLVYLISHNRTINELLKPNFDDVNFTRIFESEMNGMTTIDINVKDLIETFYQLVNKINSMLTDKDKNFLVSFKTGEPQWELLDIESDKIKNLPAIKWKLANIKKISKEKHLILLNRLKENL